MWNQSNDTEPASKPSRKTADGWITRQMAARALLVSLNSFDRYWRPHIPPDALRMNGNELEIHGSTMLEAIGPIVANAALKKRRCPTCGR